ncbi:hypothetical protein KIPB_002273 [Kipferlia bialata]|uniref:Uncharacterized protein n=1 Tax=Kipferlia bialata TaxID=797122 RepID=A0A391NUD2_9EUKA|nr:hypothetical protein KIPB_002273 [Kipferlia bialata]|eukprot:g2273.t1
MSDEEKGAIQLLEALSQDMAAIEVKQEAYRFHASPTLSTPIVQLSAALSLPECEGVTQYDAVPSPSPLPLSPVSVESDGDRERDRDTESDTSAKAAPSVHSPSPACLSPVSLSDNDA